MDGTGVPAVRVYVVYFDRVDVVASEFSEYDALATTDVLERIAQSNESMLLELQRHTDALEEATNRTLEPIR